AGRHGLHPHVVFVVVTAPPFFVPLARRHLIVDPTDIELTEGPVVKPVVPHPAVDHRIHRHRHLERRMRIGKWHRGKKSVVRDAKDADFAVALWNVFHEPRDGVIRVGRMVDGRWVQRSAQWTIYDVVSFGTVLAAYILDDTDVTAFQDHVHGVVISV